MRRYVVKKCHNNCVSSKWPTPLTSLPLPLTFMAASEPSLHTYPVYRTHFCQCSQKVKGNDADAVKECHIERAPSSVNKENRQGITFFPAFSQGVFKQVFMFTKKIAALRTGGFFLPPAEGYSLRPTIVLLWHKNISGGKKILAEKNLAEKISGKKWQLTVGR